jgi:hypothetical protein
VTVRVTPTDREFPDDLTINQAALPKVVHSHAAPFDRAKANVHLFWA